MDYVYTDSTILVVVLLLVILIGLVVRHRERRKLINAVRTSEQLRLLVYDGVSDVLFDLAVEEESRYRFLSVNSAFTLATGLPVASVIGKTVDEVIPEPSRSIVLANYAEALRDKKVVRWIEETPYPTGKKYGEVSITPLFTLSGTFLIGAVRDITEQRVADERNRTQTGLLDQAKDAMLVRETDGTVQYWNKGAEALYGWTVEEAVGKRIQDLIYDDPLAFDQGHRRLLQNGAWSGEMVQVTKAGRRLTVESRWTLLRDKDGNPKSVFAINSDVTERKALEKQVQHAQRLDSLGMLAGGIAHDFNNIITVISGNAQLAMDDLPPEHPAQEFLVGVNEAADRAAALVKRILLFGRRQEVPQTAVQLGRVVGEALRLLRSVLPANVQIRPDLGRPLPSVVADSTQIHQVITNLGTNAAHAMGERGGVLSVGLELRTVSADVARSSADLDEGQYVVLTVEDDGSGMDIATLDRIFEPFFTTKPPGRGTGLGLPVVHGIMRGHHGAITVSSTVGKGTVFNLYFPALATQESDVREGSRKVTRGDGQHVLYVDDEPTIVLLMTRRLERWGYRVTGLVDPTTALQTFRLNPNGYDIVVTDRSMPHMSGSDLAKEILRIRPEIPVVMMSGSVMPQDYEEAERIGISRLVLKASNVDELGHAIYELLTTTSK